MNNARYGRRTLGHRSGCASDRWSRHDRVAAVRAIDIIGGDGGHRRPERDRRAEPPSPHYHRRRRSACVSRAVGRSRLYDHAATPARGRVRFFTRPSSDVPVRACLALE